MDFDIYALDAIDPGSDEAEKAFKLYRRSLSDLFFTSPEGQALLQSYPDAGFWADRLLDFGFNHIGVALPNMTSRDVEEIVSEYFPRKISLRSPEDADSAIPELLAFWEFLGREFALETAQPSLRCLRGIQASFRAIMNDSSKFGMAKSFYMMGQPAGFDMTSRDGMNAFAAHYNAGLARRRRPGIRACLEFPRAQGRRSARTEKPGAKHSTQNQGHVPEKVEKETPMSWAIGEAAKADSGKDRLPLSAGRE
jgi:hypothetical protein